MNANARAVRDYSSIEIPDRSLSREERMGLLVDRLWQAFGNPKTTDPGLSADEASKLAGYSWVGFYFGPGHPFVSTFGQHLTPSAHEMLLDRRPAQARVLAHRPRRHVRTQFPRSRSDRGA